MWSTTQHTWCICSTGIQLHLLKYLVSALSGLILFFPCPWRFGYLWPAAGAFVQFQEVSPDKQLLSPPAQQEGGGEGQQVRGHTSAWLCCAPTEPGAVFAVRLCWVPRCLCLLRTRSHIRDVLLGCWPSFFLLIVFCLCRLLCSF